MLSKTKEPVYQYRKEPNYVMLSLMLRDTIRVLQKHPGAEEMPDGFICPGRDVEMMPAIAALNYLCGVKTQWSCQGNHKNKKLKPNHAYLLLPEGEAFPDDLVLQMEKHGFSVFLKNNFDQENGHVIAGTRQLLKAKFDDIMSNEAKEALNKKFLATLNGWAIQKISQHVPHIQNNIKNVDIQLLLNFFLKERH